MTWAQLLAGNKVARVPPTKGEIDDLRSIVRRSLGDASIEGLSAAAHFIFAYDAARTLSLIIVRAEGYKPKSVGGHTNTFLALEAADLCFAPISAYFDGCRMKRNTSEYDFAGGVSETEADGLLKAVQQFAIDVEAWINRHHPGLV